MGGEEADRGPAEGPFGKGMAPAILSFGSDVTLGYENHKTSCSYLLWPFLPSSGNETRRCNRLSGDGFVPLSLVPYDSGPSGAGGTHGK